jgi:uncharacterized membrane protein
MVLHVHEALGGLILLTALAAIVLPVARRVVVYLILAQVLVGIAIVLTMHLQPPVLHWLLAILVGGVYPMANAMERKQPGSVPARIVAAIAAVVVAVVFMLGMRGLHAA